MRWRGGALEVEAQAWKKSMAEKRKIQPMRLKSNLQKLTLMPKRLEVTRGISCVGAGVADESLTDCKAH